MPKTGFQWDGSRRPSRIARDLTRKVASIPPALSVLASTHAARAEGTMKAGASWNDITAHARNSLYGRSEQFTIILGTTNSEYGIFLELGTVNMAARPIIVPTLETTANEYFEDAIKLIRSILGA